MSQRELRHVPAQQVCGIEAPGHTTRHLNLPFLMAAVPVRIRVLSIHHRAITFATESGATTWFHHEPERLAAAAHNWPTSWGRLPGSNILIAQAASDDDYHGQTFFFTCSDQPLQPCTPTHREPLLQHPSPRDPALSDLSDTLRDMSAGEETKDPDDSGGQISDHTKTCPRCRGTGVPIVYGMPDSELIDLADRGEVVLGGCVIPCEAPTCTCPSCGELWGVNGRS